MYKVKVLVVGPCKSGKTRMTNILGDAMEQSEDDYHPTKGVRILEMTLNGIHIDNRTTSVEVELWDCSGDPKFEPCYPALSHEANGALLTFDPTRDDHSHLLESMYAKLVLPLQLPDGQAIVVATRKQQGGRAAAKLGGPIARLPLLEVNVVEETNKLRSAFQDLVQRCVFSLKEKRDEEEMSVVGGAGGGGGSSHVGSRHGASNGSSWGDR